MAFQASRNPSPISESEVSFLLSFHTPLIFYSSLVQAIYRRQQKTMSRVTQQRLKAWVESDLCLRICWCAQALPMLFAAFPPAWVPWFLPGPSDGPLLISVVYVFSSLPPEIHSCSVICTILAEQEPKIETKS